MKIKVVEIEGRDIKVYKRIAKPLDKNNYMILNSHKNKVIFSNNDILYYKKPFFPIYVKEIFIYSNKIFPINSDLEYNISSNQFTDWIKIITNSIITLQKLRENTFIILILILNIILIGISIILFLK